MSAMLRGRVMGRLRLTAFLLFLLPARAAFGQNDTVAAESLFQQGRALLDQGKVAEACPKLAESHRLDPATGTLIALALCHETEGKLASAWAEFSDAEGRARTEGAKDREAVAHEHATALYPRLSALTIDVSPESAATPGLEIKRDGVALGRGAWGTTVPIDGGDHVIEATAPGKQPWSSKLTVRAESEQARVTVPPLVDVAATKPVEQEKPVTIKLTDEDPKKSEKKPWGGLEWAGVSAAAAGVVALGVGGYFLMDALDHKDTAEADCNPENECTSSKGIAALDAAVKSGNTATIFAVTGGVLVAGGAALFIVGRAGAGSKKEQVGLSIGVGPHGAALRFKHHF